MSSISDVTSIVERLEAFEERLEVRLEAVSAFTRGPDDDGEWKIEVRGELHPEVGTGISMDLQVALTVYDFEGRVVQTASSSISEDEFFGFEAFELSCYSPVEVAKLRLIPKPY